MPFRPTFGIDMVGYICSPQFVNYIVSISFSAHTTTWIDSKYGKSMQLDYNKWKRFDFVSIHRKKVMKNAWMGVVIVKNVFRFVTGKVTMPAGAGKDVCGAICDFDSSCDMFACKVTTL